MLQLKMVWLALLALGSAVAASVPSVNICAYEANCPAVSRVGMGTLHLGDKIGGLSDPAEINAWITHAVQQGITLFDLADVYPVKGGDSGDSAALFGQALALTPGLRANITIVAKMDIIFPSATDTSSEHLTSTLNWFLEVLGTDYIDVLLIHYSNSLMDADATAQLFADFRDAGKVRQFGVSNHYPSKFDLLQSRLDTHGIKLVTHEMEISAWNPSYFNYNSPLVDHAYQHGLKPLAWSALGGDPLGGFNRLFQKEGTRQVKINHALKTVGDELGIDKANGNVVALLWLLSHPAQIIPLIGTTKTDRLDTMLTAFDYLGKMTNDQWWTIANAGGVCALGDSQCNYDEYRN